jgi:hypothetical protein
LTPFQGDPVLTSIRRLFNFFLPPRVQSTSIVETLSQTEPRPTVEIAVYPKLPPSGQSLAELGNSLISWRARRPEALQMSDLESLLDNTLPPPRGAYILISKFESRCFVEITGFGDQELLIQSLKDEIPASLMRDAAPSWGEYM